MKFLTLAVLLAAPLAAQESRTPIWGFLALGAGSAADSGFYASGIGLAVEMPRLMLMARIASLDTKNKKRIQDAGVLVGLAPRRGIFQFGAAAGLGVVDDSRDSSGVTIPIEAFASAHVLPWVGLGVRGFGSLNKFANFGGITVMLQLGRLRKT